MSLSGVGLHTGVKVNLTVRPAGTGEGVRFVRIDLDKRPVVPVCPRTAVMDPQVTRCTAVEAAGTRVCTIEHILAAASGLGIDNLTVDIDAEEVPGMDGSSVEFTAAFNKAGIVEQNAPKEFIEVKSPISVGSGGASLTIVPAQQFKISYMLDYDLAGLRSQLVSTVVTQEIFEQAIAPARTFCLHSEVALIRGRGLGKGADEHNTLVMGTDGPVGNSLRFPDECARHKVLDIVGDVFLLGRPLRGHVIGFKSGHALNRQLVQKIMEHERMNGKVYGINDIMNILPHRYPFLLVDKVIEIEPGKKGVGIKNVTINDGFFQGHFPSKPVMPGVLMVEAMAQTAGVVVLTGGAHPGKVALFMSIEAVKFRRLVAPGDQLVMEVEIVLDRERTTQVKGTGKVDGETVVEAEMLFSYTDKSYLKNQENVQ
ncbi:MAG: UDP-3-O-[3-hydroxymyristoyl] N-acetylglucosamine deacetylase [Candidatus Omnitrophica bacterium]|nr:UDP-3-O-[3-hydroxymyristoyl] N-acetylglucosamine deacetylase [Candidatus Omnitrophota bacterium]